MLRDDYNLCRRHLNKKNDLNYQNILKSRQNLPAWSMKANVLELIAGSQVHIPFKFSQL